MSSEIYENPFYKGNPISYFNHSEKVDEIFKALTSVESTIEQPKLDSTVDYYNKQNRRIKFSYASLAEVQNKLKEPLKESGMSLSQYPKVIDDRYFVVTLLTHADSSQWLEFLMPIFGNFNTDPKDFATSFTYARRYALYGIFNLYGQQDTDAAEIEGEKTTPVEPIKKKVDQTQVKILSHYTTQLGADSFKEFLDYFKIAKIADLAADNYGEALYKLKKAIGQGEEDENN